MARIDGAAPALPAGFADLEPFVVPWAVDGCAERAALRESSDAGARLAFYEIARDKLGSALDYLDKKGSAAFDDADKRLLNLVLSFAHVALAVEIQGPDEARHAQLARHLRIVRVVA